MSLKIKINSLLLVLLVSNLQAQNECIQEVLNLEEALYSKEYVLGDKPVYINYNINNIEWDGKQVNSNVKIYRDLNNLHFFSKEANIYQDDRDILMVLNNQRIVLKEKAPQEIDKNGHNDKFLQLRKNFLGSCEVISCTEEKLIKTLELKAKEDMDGALYIDKMIYKYDVQKKQVLSIITIYKKGYKLKKIEMIYNEINMASSYRFEKAKQYVFDKKNNLLDKYKNYEFIDNTKKQ